MSLQDELDITPLKKALETLKKGYEIHNENKNLVNEEMLDALEDSCVKRYVYTYEMVKKIMTRFLKTISEINVDDHSISNIIKEMFNKNLIKNLNNWNKYRNQRNTILYKCDIVLSRSVLDIIPNFIGDVDYLIKSIEERLE